MRTLTALLFVLILFTGCSGGGSSSAEQKKASDNQIGSAASQSKSVSSSQSSYHDTIDNNDEAAINYSSSSSSTASSLQNSDTAGTSSFASSSSSQDNSNPVIPRSSNDPFYPLAWHLHTPEKSFAATFSIDPNANAHVVWSNNNYGQGVTVAVLDDYFDPTHPDIQANVIRTYNAITRGSDVSVPALIIPHGQMCAGVIAAGFNSIGSVGVAPKVNLILIGQAYDSDAATIRAFEFAKENGADIISCSWGSYNVSPAVADEIQSVHDQNITIIFAAGNDNTDLDADGINDESELPGVIGVSASSEFNDRTSYANYGAAVDLFAPGGEWIGIPTTSVFPREDSIPYSNAYAQEYLDSGYSFFRGTSAAAPIVAGAAALLKAKDPALAPDEIRNLLIQGADKFGNVAYDQSGFEQYHAYGKLNVAVSLAILPDEP